VTDAQFNAHMSRWALPHRLKPYNLTRVQYGAIYRLQNGKCGICESAEPDCIDHDHKTGRVRGLLCGKCNSGLGMLGDDARGITRALIYLNRPQHD